MGSQSWHEHDFLERRILGQDGTGVVLILCDIVSDTQIFPLKGMDLYLAIVQGMFRQSVKIEKMEAMHADLKEQVNNLGAEKTALKEQNTTLDAEKTALKEQNTTLDAERASHDALKHELQDALEDANKFKAGYIAAYHKVALSNNVAHDAEKDTLAAEMVALQAALADEKVALEKRNAAHAAEIAALADEKAALEERNAAHAAERDAQLARHDRIRRAWAKARNASKTRAYNQIDAEELRSAKEEIASLKKNASVQQIVADELRSAEEEIASLKKNASVQQMVARQETAKRQDVYNQIRAVTQSSDSFLHVLEQNNEDLKKRNDELSSKNGTMKRRNKELATENHKLAQENEELTQKNLELLRLLDDLHAQNDYPDPQCVTPHSHELNPVRKTGNYPLNITELVTGNELSTSTREAVQHWSSLINIGACSQAMVTMGMDVWVQRRVAGVLTAWRDYATSKSRLGIRIQVYQNSRSMHIQRSTFEDWRSQARMLPHLIGMLNGDQAYEGLTKQKVPDEMSDMVDHIIKWDDTRVNRKIQEAGDNSDQVIQKLHGKKNWQQLQYRFKRARGVVAAARKYFFQSYLISATVKLWRKNTSSSLPILSVLTPPTAH